MKFRKWILSGVLLVLLVVGAHVGYRVYRAGSVGWAWQKQLRYMIETGDTIGTVPAKEALSESYLDVVLGNDPALLTDLKNIVEKGLTEAPSLNLGEVAALSITYNKTAEGSNENVTVHIMGGFPMEIRKPGFHRDGFFKKMTDRQIYSLGTKHVQFLGRDMIFFTSEENQEQHEKIIGSLFEGSVLPFAESLSRRLYHITVFPNPENIVPPQIRRHVQTLITRGTIDQKSGTWDIVVIANSPKSANYVQQVIKDCKSTAEITLSSVLGGGGYDIGWGKQYTWWAKEMLEMSERSNIKVVANVLRIRTDYEREMVNATIKTIERAMRDYRNIRETYEDSDPRSIQELAAEEAGTDNEALDSEGERVSRYWSEEHISGPDWPIAPDIIETSSSGQADPALKNEEKAEELETPTT